MSTSVKPDAELTEATDVTFDHPIDIHRHLPSLTGMAKMIQSKIFLLYMIQVDQRKVEAVCAVSPFQFVDPSIQLLTQNICSQKQTLKGKITRQTQNNRMTGL